MLYLILNLCFMWLIIIFRCSLFILEMIVWFVLLFVFILNDGFLVVNLLSVRFIFFWFVCDLGLIVIEIIGFGKFMCLRVIILLGLYKVLFVVMFFNLMVVVILLVCIFFNFLWFFVCIWIICLKCLCLFFIGL